MTIKDLARETGYSVGTVSRVLNNLPNVSDKARQTIMEAVERNGFILNTSAKNLKQQHSDSVVAIVKGNLNELFAAMLEHMQAWLAGTKYTFITEFIDEEENEVQRARQICRDQKPKGILFLGGNDKNFRTDFDKIEIPCVLVTNDAAELHFDNLSSVSTDDRKAARCAVDYLLDNGHREIALIGGAYESDTSSLRRMGWEDAQIARGMKPDEFGPHMGARYSFESGYRVMKDLLDRGIRVTAVFAVADVVAIGVISAINDSGLRVPEDISVVGFDGIRMGEYYCPKLTTIEQNAELLAKRSCELIVEHMERKIPASYEMIPFRLNRRQSVKKLD